MKQIFQIGDVVIHKGLGRKMMVLDDKLGLDFSGTYYYNGNFRCGWYENNEELLTENFTQESLEFLLNKEYNKAS